MTDFPPPSNSPDGMPTVFPPPPGFGTDPHRGPGGWRIAAPLAVLAAIAVIVVAALIGTGVIGGAAEADDTRPGRAATQKAVDEVMTRAQNIICQPLTFGYTTYDADMDAAARVLTGAAKAEFDKERETTARTVRQSKASGSCKVDDAGLISLDGDTAEILGALTVTTDSLLGGDDTKRVAGRYTLVKADDEWLISEMTILQ